MGSSRYDLSMRRTQTNYVSAEESERVNEECWRKILKKTQPGPKGTRIRGCVSQVRCTACGAMRWNDGTRCSNTVGNNRMCGSRVTTITAEEESRL